MHYTCFVTVTATSTDQQLIDALKLQNDALAAMQTLAEGTKAKIQEVKGKLDTVTDLNEALALAKEVFTAISGDAAVPDNFKKTFQDAMDGIDAVVQLRATTAAPTTKAPNSGNVWKGSLLYCAIISVVLLLLY